VPMAVRATGGDAGTFAGIGPAGRRQPRQAVPPGPPRGTAPAGRRHSQGVRGRHWANPGRPRSPAVRRRPARDTAIWGGTHETYVTSVSGTARLSNRGEWVRRVSPPRLITDRASGCAQEPVVSHVWEARPLRRLQRCLGCPPTQESRDALPPLVRRRHEGGRGVPQRAVRQSQMRRAKRSRAPSARTDRHAEGGLRPRAIGTSRPLLAHASTARGSDMCLVGIEPTGRPMAAAPSLGPRRP
jgi:hypothetical protein